MGYDSEEMSDAIKDSFVSHAIENEEGCPSNVVDVINELAIATRKVAEAITPAVPGNHDETGAYVTSLTESVMGATKGLCMIAEAIRDLAEAVRESKQAE